MHPSHMALLLLYLLLLSVATCWHRHGMSVSCAYATSWYILWLILGGLLLAASWAIIGLVLCITIVGIPLGIQAFKMAGLTLTPFGKTVEYGGGVGSVLVNIIWFVLAGLWMAIGYVGAGLLNCITIIGIPFGIQSFKMAKLALWPFGSQIRSL